MKSFKSLFATLLILSVFMVSCEKEETTFSEESLSPPDKPQSLTDIEASENFVSSEELFSRPVEILVLTHSHNDHWVGASAFDEKTL